VLGGIKLQQKRSKIYCVILTICLVASCLCFDNLKADGLMYSFDAINQSGQIIIAGNNTSDESGQIITTSYNSSNEDMCATEIQGNIHTSLRSNQTTSRNSETQRKSDSQYFLFGGAAYLQSPFKFFTTANSNICIANINIAELIHYIHAKDGKKRI
jgi:hypothetical protein